MKSFTIAVLAFCIFSCEVSHKQYSAAGPLADSLFDTLTIKSDIAEKEMQMIKSVSYDMDRTKVISLDSPTVITIFSNSKILNGFHEKYGADFESIADDANWYQAMMSEHMDSLNISVLHLSADTVIVHMAENQQVLVQDSTFGIYTYFYFNGDTLSRSTALELIDF